LRASESGSSLLMGKLFDEHGAGLTPSHTKKGQRRYRYYVSRSLVTGAGPGGWRVPAVELERIVMVAASKMLYDQRLLVTAVESSALDAAQIAALFQVAKERSRQLQSMTEGNGHLASLLERVELRPEALRVSLKLPIAAAASPSATVSITHELPIQLRRRGIEQRLLIPGAVPAARIDRALLKAVARAHCWLEDLTYGRVASMAAIASREGVGKHYVSRLIRLGLLAPEVVELIAQGRQAPELTAQSLLTGKREVALSWQAQKQTFGLVAQA